MAKVTEMRGGWKSAEDFNLQANVMETFFGNGDKATQMAKFH
jgi:hypothetical protein